VLRRDEAGYRVGEPELRGALGEDARTESGVPAQVRGVGGSGRNRETHVEIRGSRRESPPGANEFAAGRTQSPPSRTVAESVGRNVETGARWERTRWCVGRRTGPGRRVRAGGLCVVVAANSFAPAGGRHGARVDSGSESTAWDDAGGYTRVADALVRGSPHGAGPPSPRRRTLRSRSGEFIRSCRRMARCQSRFATGINRPGRCRRSYAGCGRAGARNAAQSGAAESTQVPRRWTLRS
jgi:hypothetical protein